MKKISIIGERAKYVFESLSKTGELVMEISTAEDYNSRFLNGNDNPPKKDGYIFRFASRVYEYDTPDGDMHEGEYAHCVERGIDKVFMKLSSSVFLNMSKSDVKDFQSRADNITYKGRISELDAQKVKEIPQEDLL